MPISGHESYHRRHCPSRSQRKLLLFFLKCIIMLAFISLFLFFLGFAAVVLLNFLLVSTTFNRRCNRHHKNAAAAETLHHLPDAVYSEAAFPRLSDCAICLDCFEEGDVCRDLPICKHIFHARCVDRWIEKKPNCPVCRTRVELDPTGLPGSRISRGDPWKRIWAVNFEEGTSY